MNLNSPCIPDAPSVKKKEIKGPQEASTADNAKTGERSNLVRNRQETGNPSRTLEPQHVPPASSITPPTSAVTPSPSIKKLKVLTEAIKAAHPDWSQSEMVSQLRRSIPEYSHGIWSAAMPFNRGTSLLEKNFQEKFRQITQQMTKQVRRKSSLAIFLIPLFLLSLSIGCTEQSDYPSMAIGFPMSQEGIDIVTASGKPVDKLRSPWIFTVDQLQGSLFPLAYYVYSNPWKEAAFVSADQITFCPQPTQGRWQSFSIHSAQMGTLEGASYKTENGQVIFSISIDRGPHFEFVYRCQKGLIEVIDRRESLGW